MGKDIEEKKLKKEKKDKKEKKEKRAESDGVSKSKKDKKEKKADVDMVDALEAELEKEPEVSILNVVDGDEPRGALVPFAFPLSDESKEVKKILKAVKKCTLHLHSQPAQPQNFGTNTTYSRQNQNPPPRRQRSCQSAPQIRRHDPRPQEPARHRHHRRRHFAHGRHLAHPRAVRGPRHTLHLHQVARTAGRGERDQEADERGHGEQGPYDEE